jgi:hypothetical protein
LEVLEEKLRTLRGGSKLVDPEHVQSFTTVSKLYVGMWLATIRNRMKGKKWSHPDLILGPDQDSGEPEGPLSLIRKVKGEKE